MTGVVVPVSTVWAVEWNNELPAEVDSLWASYKDADARATDLNRERGTSAWKAQPWIIGARVRTSS